MLWQRPSSPNNPSTQAHKTAFEARSGPEHSPTLIGPASAWSSLRHHTNSQELTAQARDYIRHLMRQPS